MSAEEPTPDPVVEAEIAVAQDTLTQFLRLAHCGDSDALFDSVYALPYGDIPVVLVAAVDFIADEDAVLGYARQMGWIE